MLILSQTLLCSHPCDRRSCRALYMLVCFLTGVLFGVLHQFLLNISERSWTFSYMVDCRSRHMRICIARKKPQWPSINAELDLLRSIQKDKTIAASVTFGTKLFCMLYTVCCCLQLELYEWWEALLR